MIDLHTHSLLSDGALLPSELVRRARVKGYTAIAITDHVDCSNIELVAAQIVNACKQLNRYWKDIKVIPGVEITHAPVEEFASLVGLARGAGIKLVVGHGETISEPVIKGTNRAAIKAGVDILAHPGLITEDDVKLAKKKNVFLEITSKPSHAYTNGYVAAISKNIGAKLVLNTDSHNPADLIDKEHAIKILKGAGIHQPLEVFHNSKSIIDKVL